MEMKFENKKVMLSDGDKFVFTTEECIGNGSRVSVSYKNLPRELSAGDNVVQSDMPAELLDEIVSFIQGADEKEQVRAVYLVKKIITDDFSSDIFLLVFRNDYDGEACSALYRKVFDFLDTHPSDKQFSLFVYDKSYNAVLKKVKDYIVFER